MRRLFIFSIILMTSALLSAVELETSVNRTVAVEGDVFYFTMTYDQAPDDIQLPPLTNGEWITNIQQRGTSYVNGKRLSTLSVGIRGHKPGILKIPSFTLKFKGKPQTAKAIEVKIVPRGEQPVNTGGQGEQIPMKEAVFGVMRYDGDRKSCYVGEEVPLRLSLYVLPALRPRLTRLPVITADSLIFRNYRWRNGETREFQEIETRNLALNGRTYVNFEFLTEFRAITPGKIIPEAEITLEISQPRQRGGDLFDSGFFSMFDGTPYKVAFEAPPELEVKPLPPAPRDAIALGLVGKWEVGGAFDQETVKAGEALTLTLKLTGSGATEGMIAPKLTFDMLRSYPPEIKKESDGSTLIRYALIPLKTGDFSALLKFSTFNPEAERYDIHDLALSLDIQPGETQAGIALDEGHSNEGSPARPPEPPRERTELFYQKSNTGKPIALPLYRNTLLLTLMLTAAGILIAVTGELLYRFRRRAGNDPEYLRKRRLKQLRPQVIAELKQCDSGDRFDRVLREKVLPFLAENYALPPGATAQEIAAGTADPEIRTLLESSGENSYQPGVTPKTFRSESVKQLIFFLKRLSLLIVVLFAFRTQASTEAGNELFAHGDFKGALEEYRKDFTPASPSANLLYNLGGGYYRLNDLPRARLYLEQARLLAPRDYQTKENLNLVNRRLLQPPVGKNGSFSSLLISCRDWLRPDEHMLLGAAFFFLLCVTFAARRKLPRALYLGFQGLFLLLLLISATAVICQYNGSYNPRRAIVTGQLELRTLPGDVIGSVSATIPGGSSAMILEKRGEYWRIECNGRTGWAKADRIAPLLP